MSGTIERLSPEQMRGADPGQNRWMSASAGTGKTQVLTARIKRLLLQGVPPHAILAITFTRAGAAEMARRLRRDLAGWVRMDARALQKELHAIGDEAHDDPARIALARTLFAAVIDAPGGGLAVQTIHSFCQSLLSAFPEEAGLAPGFRAMDEAEQAALRGEAIADFVAHAERNDPAMRARIADLALRFDESSLRAYLFRCAAAGPALDALPAGLGPWLRAAFGLPREGGAEAWTVAACADESIDRLALEAVAETCGAWNTKGGSERCAAIREWLALAPDARARSLGQLYLVFATTKGELRSDWHRYPALAGAADHAAALHARLGEILATATGMRSADLLADGLDAGRAFARALADRKRREGLVDFDDLIRMTADLLRSPGRADWIRYKLDARIDHILVDEAQDTNRAQWDIVWALAEEFFAGEGASDSACRTLFVVGDYKQAIYGFQGTSPDNFRGARERFFAAAEDAVRPFADVAINDNYRSSPPILKVVDEVVAGIGPQALGLTEPALRHISSHQRTPGRVVLWPLVPQPADEAEEAEAGEEGWIDSATRTLADRIACSVRGWIDEGIDGEPVHPRDVMVLVRKRTDLAGLVVSRLQARGVPVAGVDRLRLRVPIAVQDLVAAARFALQPLDDLSLANLLVSPLLGWTHDELIEHGWRQDADGRSGALWPHLRQRVAEDALPATRIAPLYDLLNMAGNVTPHRFFETILSGPMRGRAALLARLGNAARDPIEELVSKALDYQTREGASLLGFVAAFDRGDVDIKRELDNEVDEVRVMTVHGSKGLQSRIVILADAAGDPAANKERGAEWPTEAGPVPLLPIRRAERPEVLQAIADALSEKEMQEHWRLLYVAMTRAERMLFVGGTLGRRAKDELPPADSWYAAIEPVVEALGDGWQPAPATVWGCECAYVVGGTEPRRLQRDPPPPAPEVPDWARAPAPDEPRPSKPLAPSALGEAEALEVPRAPAEPLQPGMAAERGVLMHSLFERLPPVAPERRREAGARWLERAGAGFDGQARDAMLDAVLAVLDDPAHAALFAPGSLAEVPFSALVDGVVVAGAMDRLLITGDAVRVVDYKTGAHVPAHAADVPVGYLRQMAAYAAALGVIFPGRRVEAALLFTGGPVLIDLPDELLRAHKPGYAADNKASARAG